MGDKRIYLVLLAIGILLVADIGLYFRLDHLEDRVQYISRFFRDPEPLAHGEKAPDFSLVDTSDKSISRSDYEGVPLLLVFSSIDCPACQAFWSDLRAFHESHPSIQVLMISRGEPHENKSVAEDQRFDFPVLQWDDEMARAFKVPGLPYIYLISNNGLIEFSAFGNGINGIDETILEGAGR